MKRWIENGGCYSTCSVACAKQYLVQSQEWTESDKIPAIGVPCSVCGTEAFGFAIDGSTGPSFVYLPVCRNYSGCISQIVNRR